GSRLRGTRGCVESVLPQALRARQRVLVGPFLVVEVMHQPGNPAQLLVLPELPRVCTHGGFDGVHVPAQALAVDVLPHELERPVPVEHTSLSTTCHSVLLLTFQPVHPASYLGSGVGMYPLRGTFRR